jgi:plastocyanin
VQVFVNNSNGKALADMVIYLEPLDGQILEKSNEGIIVGQFGQSFSPYLSVSQVNSKVNFVNKDDITHHIYSAGSDNKFSFKIRAGKTNSSTTFDHPSEVAMGCNIHDWMSGYLLVVNTPYFNKTDKRGQVSFTIEKQGRYKVIVWHPQMQAENNRMIIEKNISENATFTFNLKRAMENIPMQKSDDDFDFLSDY